MKNKNLRKLEQEATIKLFERKNKKKHEKFVRYMREKYNDWEDNEYNCGPNKFIFGIKSAEDYSKNEPSFDTLNDFEIYFNRSNGIYYLSLDPNLDKYTIDKEFFMNTLKEFTEFMLNDGYWPETLDKSYDFNETSKYDNIYSPFESISLIRLYINYKTFVLGMNADNKITNYIGEERK